MLVEYDGPPLRSGQRVTWQVKVWTELGESAVVAVEPIRARPARRGRLVGALDRAVRAGGGRPPGERPAWLPARRVRGRLEPTVASARLYATAHGVYEAFLNGQRVGDAELTPGYTEYRSRLQVQTYDVSRRCAPDTT